MKQKKKKIPLLLKQRKKVEELVHSKVSGQQFVDYLVMINELSEEQASLSYDQAINKKCRYFVTWCLTSITGPDKELQQQFKIHEGTVKGKHHVWLEYKGFYIDGTIAQFYPEKEDIFIISKNAGKAIYRTGSSYSLVDWFKKEESSIF